MSDWWKRWTSIYPVCLFSAKNQIKQIVYGSMYICVAYAQWIQNTRTFICMPPWKTLIHYLIAPHTITFNSHYTVKHWKWSTASDLYRKWFVIHTWKPYLIIWVKHFSIEKFPIKGIVHPNILSRFTQPQVVSNLYTFLYSKENKEICFDKW